MCCLNYVDVQSDQRSFRYLEYEEIFLNGGLDQIFS